MIKNALYCEQLVMALRERNIAFAPGLTDREVARTEALYGFRFPPDLRQLLQYALPISEGFVDWRNAKEEELGWRVEEPKHLQTLDYSTLSPLPLPAVTPRAPRPLRFWDAVMAEWG